MTFDLVVVGAGGHAKSVTNVAVSCGYRVACYVDDARQGGRFLGVPVISMVECVRDHDGINLVVAVGDNAARERIFLDLRSRLPSAVFPSLVHRSCTIGLETSIGEGSVLMPQANVGPFSTIGRCCIVNTGASIDHDGRMGDFSSLAPGAITGGNVSIGTRSAISIGAVLKHAIRIGDDTIVGANSYAHQDIGDGVLAYGSPCREIRHRKKGEPYLD